MVGHVTVRGLGTPAARAVPILIIPVRVPAVTHGHTGLDTKQEVLTQGGVTHTVTPCHVTRGLAHLVTRHTCLLEELLGVEGVQGPEVVGDGQQLGEHGGVVRVLGRQDVLQDHLQLGLHLTHNFGITKPGPVYKQEIELEHV